MLQIAHAQKTRTVSVPTNISTLSVSWLNSQFKCIAVQRGVVEGSWEHPGEIEGTQHFEELIREGVKQTGYRGTTVSLVLMHPRLSQQLLETPPLRGPALTKFVQTQARQQKLFEAEAAFAFQPAFSAPGSQRLVLHLFPRILLDQLVQAAQKNDLFLTSVLPATAVLQSQLPEFGVEKDGIAVLAANMGRSTTVIIGRNDGQLLLARTLNGSWSTDAARLAVDLSRTILFVNQQYGVAVDKGLWLFGPNAKDHFTELQRHVQVPVKLSPVEYSPMYWATEALRQPLGQMPNFISLELQKAPQRQALLKLTTAATILTVGASLGASIWCQHQVGVERANLANLQSQQAKLQSRHLELQRLEEELLRKKGMVHMVSDDRIAPVANWLLASLAEFTPAELVVTNLLVQREAELWKVELGGMSQAGVHPTGPAAFQGAVSQLKAKLAGAPFHLRLVEVSVTNVPAATKAPLFSGWSTRPANPGRAKEEPVSNFKLEGTMR